MRQFQGYYTIPELRDRGWHVQTIKQLFRRPDRAFRAGEQQVDAFRETLVLQLEKTQDFKRLQAGAALITPLECGAAALSLDDLGIQPLSRTALRDAATQYDNSKHGKAANYRPLLMPEERYTKMELDYLLAKMGKKIRIGDRRSIDLRETTSTDEALLRRIATMYPHLANECAKRSTES